MAVRSRFLDHVRRASEVVVAGRRTVLGRRIQAGIAAIFGSTTAAIASVRRASAAPGSGCLTARRPNRRSLRYPQRCSRDINIGIEFCFRGRGRQPKSGIPPEPAGRGIGLVGSRDGVVGEALFNQQQSALSVAVEGIYGVEQALTLDQPRLVVLTDVEHEHEILCFEVAADR